MKTRKSVKKTPVRRRAKLKASRLRESRARRTFPFSSIVGQHEMKLALLLNVIDPSIGGVLLMGHRGTGKSTAVRGLAELLPEIEVVSSCPYRCNPRSLDRLCADCSAQLDKGRKLTTERVRVSVIDLPLGATEDRVCGTIDIERALREGRKAFEPGLLARANRGFLYIDEVNLLEDHLVDLLLDAAATGWNRVERESISIEHPAKFVLVGSGNPEEGELRPQLQDRFGLQVEVTTENSADSRAEVVARQITFELDKESFFESSESEQTRLRKQIVGAIEAVQEVELDPLLLHRIAALCSELKIDGHRGELTIARAARALSAFEGLSKVTENEVRRVAVMCLRHRLRRDPLEETASAQQIIEALDRLSLQQTTVRKAKSDKDRSPSGSSDENGHGQAFPSDSTIRNSTSSAATAPKSRASEARLAEPEASTLATPSLRVAATRPLRSFLRSNYSPGSRSQRSNSPVVSNERGRYQRAVIKQTPRIAFDATLRASAERLSPGANRQQSSSRLALRYKLLAHKQGPLFIFAIDTSGSMARRRIAIAKKILLGLLKKAYLNRDRVAILTFAGTAATLRLPPSQSILRARRVLDSLIVGGGTPLSAGISCSLSLAKRTAAHQGSSSILLLFTDGGANVSQISPAEIDPVQRQRLIEREIAYLGSELRRANVQTVVVNTREPFRRDAKVAQLAAKLNAQLISVPDPTDSDSPQVEPSFALETRY